MAALFSAPAYPSPILMANPDSSKPVGVLLINLGTPASAATADVRRYLREFLSDPLLIDLPRPLRRALLELVILPTRSRSSAAAYAKIWTRSGSPLLVHSIELRDALAEKLGGGFSIELGMRYGTPSLASALEELGRRNVQHLLALPLFPQLAEASTGSALARLHELLAGSSWSPELHVIESFYAREEFVTALAAAAEPALEGFGADHVLMSFHGLPERHVRRADPTKEHCLASAACCDSIHAINASCYRAQCFATASAVSRKLGLASQRFSVAFQSRFGRARWIAPYTDELLPVLAARGVRRLAVLCPAFVADCLETLEEIGIRARAQWRELGGEELLLVPSLNASPAWVDGLARLIRSQAPSVST